MDPDPKKGAYKGLCNFTACTSQRPATWWHFSNQKYYCPSCAAMLNHANRKDALALFGHELLIPVEPPTLEGLTRYSPELGNPDVTPYAMMVSNKEGRYLSETEVHRRLEGRL